MDERVYKLVMDQAEVRFVSEKYSWFKHTLSIHQNINEWSRKEIYRLILNNETCFICQTNRCNRRIAPCGHVACSECVDRQIHSLLSCPVCGVETSSSKLISFEIISRSEKSLDSALLENLKCQIDADRNVRKLNKVVISVVGNFNEQVSNFLLQKLETKLEQVTNGFFVKAELGYFIFSLLFKNGSSFRNKQQVCKRSILYEFHDYIVVHYNTEEPQESLAVSAFISSDLILWINPQQKWKEVIPSSCYVQYHPLEMELVYPTFTNDLQEWGDHGLELYKIQLEPWMITTFREKIGEFLEALENKGRPKPENPTFFTKYNVIDLLLKVSLVHPPKYERQIEIVHPSVEMSVNKKIFVFTPVLHKITHFALFFYKTVRYDSYDYQLIWRPYFLKLLNILAIKFREKGGGNKLLP